MHLITYLGRNHSGTFDQNLLWNEGSAYIMDNHRAAAWCWAKTIAPTERFSIFHIDQHADLLQSRLDEWCENTPPIETLDLQRYLDLTYAIDGGQRCPLFRWDNYMSIFIRQRESYLNTFEYIWHNIGDKPWFEDKSREHHDYDAPMNLSHWLSREPPWVVNLDLDFFFSGIGNGLYVQMYSDDYVIRLANELKRVNSLGHIKCLTIAISPEMCGGWGPGVRILNVFSKAFGIIAPKL